MSKITVVSTKSVWKSDDGQKEITQVNTTDGKKLKSWSSDWSEGQSYDVNITKKPSKNPKFGDEYWAEPAGPADSAPSVGKPEGKNRAFALSYAKDIVVAIIAAVPDYAKTVDPVEATTSIAEGFRQYLDNENPDNLPL